ncbi:HD-GYP domain-containing protein [Fervidobacterium sp. 2310opik-2]|uniref:HD-GYP domain-containing protein n=1 Tax=Fervidobacterium sp. 2310opik-2 TaxID=1755815 RepID=UPI001F4937C5|nr:HD-GYP domain-containing protein [Fervidobacterium sp. 2310opik-2]
MDIFLTTIAISSASLNIFLLFWMRKNNKKIKYLSSQLQKFRDLSTKFRDIVVQREELFYKNIHEVSLSFVNDVENSCLVTFQGENGKIVSYKGKIFNPSIISSKKVKKTDFPYSAERVYVTDRKKFADIFDNSINSDSKVLVSDIHIGGELKAKLLLEKEKPFVSEEIEILKSLSGFMTSFIATHTYLSNQGRFQKDMIITMIRILEYHDPYTKGHSKNVANLASLLAEKLGLSDEMIKKTYWAALVHDIGKIVIPSSILNKEGKLTIEEFEVIKKHPVYGHDFLSTSDELKELGKYVLHHHERWDGKGYPAGLSKEDIPLISRIISVVDAWDAMRSDRPYRKGLPEEIAKKELIEHSGVQFDPNIVKAFLEIV